MNPVFWKNFLAALLCLGVVVYFSNLPLANQDIRPMLSRYPVLAEGIKLLPRMHYTYAGKLIDSRANAVNFISFSLRKCAHVLLYGLFGLFWINTLSALGVKGSRRWLIAVLTVLAVAALDEQNQNHVTGRSGLYQDFMLDLTGFLVVAFLYRVLGKLSNRHN